MYMDVHADAAHAHMVVAHGFRSRRASPSVYIHSLYIGWFGAIMISCLLSAASPFIIAFLQLLT